MASDLTERRNLTWPILTGAHRVAQHYGPGCYQRRPLRQPQARPPQPRQSHTRDGRVEVGVRPR